MNQNQLHNFKINHKWLIEKDRLARILINLYIVRIYLNMGIKYFINPDTEEMHKLSSKVLSGSHNLVFAKLEYFIPLKFDSIVPLDYYPENKLFNIYTSTGEFIKAYHLNKCKHCFAKNILKLGF